MFICSRIMMKRQNSVSKIEMWLSEQYWEMFYSDYDASGDKYENKNDGDNNNKKVTFNDEDEVKEIVTENQFYYFTKQ